LPTSADFLQSDEVYKNQTRSFIRDWLSLLAARRNTTQTPLIVLVNTAANAGATGKTVFGRDKGVIAKLRTDFNTQKRDRSVFRIGISTLVLISLLVVCKSIFLKKAVMILRHGSKSSTN
jgi:presenilin-like A22 family membrane protease